MQVCVNDSDCVYCDEIMVATPDEWSSAVCPFSATGNQIKLLSTREPLQLCEIQVYGQSKWRLVPSWPVLFESLDKFSCCILTKKFNFKNSDKITGKYNKIGLLQLYIVLYSNAIIVVGRTYSINSSFENPVFWAVCFRIWKRGQFYM